MKKLLVVPRSCTNEILSLSHDLPASGHQGQDRTLQRCKQRFYWYNMTHDVKRFVASCSVCNRNKKPNRKAKWQLTPYHAGVPMERVHLDFLGPLPTTKDDNSYILVIVDQFTKWVECIPLPSQSAEDTARAAINHFSLDLGSHSRYLQIEEPILRVIYSNNYVRDSESIRQEPQLLDLQRMVKLSDSIERSWMLLGVLPAVHHLNGMNIYPN